MPQSEVLRLWSPSQYYELIRQWCQSEFENATISGNLVLACDSPAWIVDNVGMGGV